MPDFSIVPARSLNLTYIVLDSIALVVFLGLLLWKRRNLTVIVAVTGGILYFIVDYVFFYHVSHSRVVLIDGKTADEVQTAFYLLWHELSSGISNFALIWLCLKKDKNLPLWLSLVIGWWLLLPAIAQLGSPRTIQTYRTTAAYHGPMAIIAAISYLILIVYCLTDKAHPKPNVPYLFLVGFGIQFAWEGAFLLYGIRPWNENAIPTLLIDSLVETNLGMPAFWALETLIQSRWNEDGSRIKLGK